MERDYLKHSYSKRISELKNLEPALSLSPHSPPSFTDVKQRFREGSIQLRLHSQLTCRAWRPYVLPSSLGS